MLLSLSGVPDLGSRSTGPPVRSTQPWVVVKTASHGHLSVKGVIIGSLWQFPADVFERCPGLSPSLSWPCRTRTTSHSVGAHGSRTTIPLTSGRAREARPFSKSGCCGHAVLRFARLDPSGPDQDPAG